jgi:hypothetical protein
MRSATILAVVLLAAIFVMGFYASGIKAAVVTSIYGEDNYGCVINGVPCTCYSKECVCEGKIYPISACT